MLTCSSMTIRSVRRYTASTPSRCYRARGPAPRSAYGGLLESTCSSNQSPQITLSPWCRRYNSTAAANTSAGWWHTTVVQSDDDNRNGNRNRSLVYQHNITTIVVPHRRFASTATTTPSSIESNAVRREQASTTTSSTNDRNESAATPPPHTNNKNSNNSEPLQSSSSTTTDHNTPPDLHDLNNDDNDPHSSSSTFRTNLRARYRAKRNEYQCRAVDYRDTARTHYQEFKDHPRQSARDSAVSIRGMMQRYGPVFIGTYGTLYLSTLALLFGGVESGALDPVILFQWLGQEQTADSTVQLVVDFMEQYDWTKPYAHVVERNPSVANLAVAWIAVKFTEPIRLALSVAITPRLARYFGYTAVAAASTETTTTTIDDNDNDDTVVDPRTQARAAASATDQSKRTNHKA